MTRTPLSEAVQAARAGLAAVVEPGSWSVHAAVEELGAVEVWAAMRRGRPLPGVGRALTDAAAARAVTVHPEALLDRLHAGGGRLACPGDDEWPAHRLGWGPGTPYAPPLGLFLRGAARLGPTVEASVAVVGARAATAYGNHVAHELAFELAEAGWAVVSGAAYGIDRAAHLGALASGRSSTVAVLACGVDVAYPRGHTALLERIADVGLVASESPPGVAPTRARFLVRNRVIAALTAGTVVVEAAARSGSLATLQRARELYRHVMVVPGPVTSALSVGCHQELRADDPAICVTRAAEVLDTVGRLGDDAAEAPRATPGPRDDLPATARRVLDALPVRGGAGEAAIARDAGLSTLAVAQLLPPLLVAGLVERGPSGWLLSPLGAGRPARGAAS